MFRPRVGLLVAAVSLMASRAALACPLCGDNLANDVYGNQTSNLGRGFFWSIILMVTMEFALVGFIVLKVYLSTQRAKAAAASRALTESMAETV